MAKMVSWYDGGRGYTGESCRQIPSRWVELYHLKPCLLGGFELLWGPVHPRNLVPRLEGGEWQPADSGFQNFQRKKQIACLVYPHFGSKLVQ